ncbi:MAG: putative selenium-dependent hydroxylase accessory protein YqeC [Clostridiales Family XIII bacterium]|jgi:hypothetical protein|nr:putative selenium-dependent hydroxylase accessory protein YqeC [Clostridiales Family XIII bacterium]
MESVGAVLAPFLENDGEIVTLTGSGGKTTLLWRLAGHFRARRVLATTTTHMLMPDPGCYDRFLDGAALAGADARAGVTFALEAPPLKALARAARRYDLVLVEGDGSKTLPLKGWAPYEPAVPPFSTCTIGVASLRPLGSPATESCVFRLPLFCQQSGAAPGEVLTEAHYAAALSHPDGPMKGSRGKRILWLNQAESAEDFRRAEGIARRLPDHFAGALSAVCAGSARNDEGVLLWKG